MTLVEINIDTKKDKSIPKKIIIDTDSKFFVVGEIIEFPAKTTISNTYVAIKVIKVTKQFTTSLTSYKPKIVVYAERY